MLKVAKRSNSYFSTTAASFVNKFPTGTGIFGLDHIKQFYSKSNISKSTFSFQHITENFVHKILLSLNSNKATALDLIPTQFLKDGTKFITFRH